MQLNATVLVSCFRTEGPGLEPTELTAAETAKAGQRCSAGTVLLEPRAWRRSNSESDSAIMELWLKGIFRETN